LPTGETMNTSTGWSEARTSDIEFNR
jgi:hypothetical protein